MLGVRPVPSLSPHLVFQFVTASLERCASGSERKGSQHCAAVCHLGSGHHNLFETTEPLRLPVRTFFVRNPCGSSRSLPRTSSQRSPPCRSGRPAPAPSSSSTRVARSLAPGRRGASRRRSCSRTFTLNTRKRGNFQGCKAAEPPDRTLLHRGGG